MKIMVDTNIIVSAALFKGKAIAELLDYIFNNHQLVLSNTIIDEVKEVIKYKFPSKLCEMDAFFESISFEYQHTATGNAYEIDIRDVDDRKIIASARMAQVDILITGDNDFFDRKYDELEILRPIEFVNKYIKQKNIP